jgi:ribosome-binding protein aMBF1 (putative translation factor)
MFSCEMCGNNLAVNNVILLDQTNVELCDECVDIMFELNQIITASRFSVSTVRCSAGCLLSLGSTLQSRFLTRSAR